MRARSCEAAGAPVEASSCSGWRRPAIELIVGVVGDPRFGPLVACGAGGVAVELLGDVQVAPRAARADAAAATCCASCATFPLLDGYRGAPARGRRLR